MSRTNIDFLKSEIVECTDVYFQLMKAKKTPKIFIERKRVRFLIESNLADLRKLRGLQ